MINDIMRGEEKKHHSEGVVVIMTQAQPLHSFFRALIQFIPCAPSFLNPNPKVSRRPLSRHRLMHENRLPCAWSMST